MKPGDLVTPKTKAGLELADVSTDGKYDQQRNVVCVFRGKGTVLDTKDVIIDYDSWPDSVYDGLGKVEYQSVLISCKNGIGWAGEGALIKI